MWPNVLQRICTNNRKKEVSEGERKVVGPAGPVVQGPGGNSAGLLHMNTNLPLLGLAELLICLFKCCVRRPLSPKEIYGLPNAMWYLGLDPGTEKRPLIEKWNKVWGLVNIC